MTPKFHKLPKDDKLGKDAPNYNDRPKADLGQKRRKSRQRPLRLGGESIVSRQRIAVIHLAKITASPEREGLPPRAARSGQR